jgi:hypothetical protein
MHQKLVCHDIAAVFVRTYCPASSRNVIVYRECTHLWSLLSKLPNLGWQEVSERCERKRTKSDLRLAGTDMKAFGGNRCIAPLILNLSKKMEVSGGLRVMAASPPAKGPLVLNE